MPFLAYMNSPTNQIRSTFLCLDCSHALATNGWHYSGPRGTLLSPMDCPLHRTYVPSTLQSQVMSWVHSSLCSGHPGTHATIKLLQNRFWWRTLITDTQNCIRNCNICATSKFSKLPPAGLLQPLPTPQWPWLTSLLILWQISPTRRETLPY